MISGCGPVVRALMRISPLLLPALAAGCALPAYQATKVVNFTVPAAGIDEVVVDSHNGDLVVTGDAAATEVAVRAELSVRGHSQAEADADLHLLEITREQVGNSLRLGGRYPPAGLGNRSPTFQFTLTVPPRLAVRLTSHNGDVRLTGIDGDAIVATHNGDVEGRVAAARVEARTHNGDVVLEVAGVGRLEGEVQSHNGNVEVHVAPGRSTWLTASTHNGRVTPPPRPVDAEVRKRNLRCRLGDGSGRFVIEAHNGDVVVR